MNDTNGATRTANPPPPPKDPTRPKPSRTPAAKQAQTIESQRPASDDSLREALCQLADNCDGARSRDGHGFNQFDTGPGKALAQRKRWSRRDRTRALKLAHKYRNQLPPDLREQIVEASEADGSEESPASGPTGDSEDRITPDLVGEEILRTEHFAKDRGDRLYHWENGSYTPTGETFLKQRVKAALGSWEALNQWRSFLAKEVIEYILADAPFLWDRPPTDVINVLNGLLQIKTGKLLPHIPDHLSPIQLPVRFDRKATCPAWKGFVRDVFPNDSRQLAWEILGDLMQPDRSWQKAILLIGEGGTGKSTFLTAASAFLGKANVAAVDLHTLEGNRFATSQLVGKLGNISADLPTKDLQDTAIFKAITGGDRIRAERKHKPAFSFLPYVRLVFSANHAPRSKDTSEAFWDRWLLIPFDKRFRGTGKEVPRSKLDAQLADSKELSGVLNLALKALRRLRKRGHFTESAAMRKAKAEFREVTDHLSIWLDREVVVDPNGEVKVAKLRRLYNAAADEDGRPVMTATAFGKAMAEAFPDIKKRRKGPRGAQEWAYRGIRLRGLMRSKA